MKNENENAFYCLTNFAVSTEQDIEVKEKEYNHKRRESHLAYRIKESLKRTVFERGGRITLLDRVK